MQPTQLRAVQPCPARPDASAAPATSGGAPAPTRWPRLLARTAVGAGQEIVATAATVCGLPIRLGDVVLGVRNQVEPGLLPRVRDASARPVVLVHGFAASATCWFALHRALRADGRTVASFEYWPWAASVDDLAERLAGAVEDVLAVTGADKVHLVGHSLGGIVIAHALTEGRLAGCVDRVITLGSPFRGTPWAGRLPAGPVVWALRPGSPLLRRLAAASPPAGVRWLAFASDADRVVPAECAFPVNQEVRRVTIEGAGHSGMLVAPDVIARIVAETRTASRTASPAAETVDEPTVYGRCS